MKVQLTLVSTLLVVTGCAQFTTSDAELANLKAAADARANTYIECMKTEAGRITGDTDPEFIKQAVAARCKSSLDAYSEAEKEHLSAQYMMASKPLGIAVTDLKARGDTAVAEVLVNRAQQSPATAPAPAPAAAPNQSFAAAAAAAAAVATTWSPKQRVYLDCMEEQADKYGRLNESAEAIADVAADKCKTYLGTERRAALEEEGRVKVMSRIMDQRLAPGTRR